MAKESTYRGKTAEELAGMSRDQVVAMLTARERRAVKRGMSEPAKKLYRRVAKGESNIKTHAREAVILPELLGHTIGVHNGKEFTKVTITIDMIGYRLGEFALTRRRVGHSSPGVGATRSSSAISVR
ncbi:30S ribosomal protein S19 [Candidatus Woesearchaeota archaeon CG_4_10_14_0_2_um_filter_57_5]|nr:MAG: 30S ribosomal protein S19 [Candidatus Woesearchaeota archaeon CG1_02_57_44]PIN70393.1 MAG: 30S ribosomal protein S19 [Candidatus Woesearchaeota archaeon CG11_big_fil_rev_8_21_14_0_20_57_5]PIZ52796.1 MAG: 30S ribosomal protein S19 [Candidatus Woesearchaeota archaeon CG_4_10_14_0_2_um_filter_57_5]